MMLEDQASRDRYLAHLRRQKEDRESEKIEADARRKAAMSEGTSTMPRVRPARTTSARIIDGGESAPSTLQIVHVVREDEPPRSVVRDTHVVYRAHSGPRVLLTTRDAVISRPGTPTAFDSGRSIESAITEASELAIRSKKDVVVWSGNKVAAVVVVDLDGRVAVTPFDLN